VPERKGSRALDGVRSGGQGAREGCSEEVALEQTWMTEAVSHVGVRGRVFQAVDRSSETLQRKAALRNSEEQSTEGRGQSRGERGPELRPGGFWAPVRMWI
jgi:hypothetical protein